MGLELDTDEHGSSILTPLPEPEAVECWNFLRDHFPFLAKLIVVAVSTGNAHAVHDPRPLYQRPVIQKPVGGGDKNTGGEYGNS